MTREINATVNCSPVIPGGALRTKSFWLAVCAAWAVFVWSARVRADEFPSEARDQVFQYAVAAKDVNDKEITVWLWIPPGVERIRGVLIGGLTLMEQDFVVDPIIRRACLAEQLAIVYCYPSIDAVFDYKEKRAGERLQKTLNDLAEASGYGELAVAPWFPFGHSVSSLFASHVVCFSPSRCFGAMLFKGGIQTPPNDPQASLVGVPILVVKGQFEEFGPGPSGVLRDFEDREAAWNGMRDKIVALREQDERHLISYLVEPGATHYGWSDSVARFVAEFIRKAAQRRIPDWPADAKESIRCRSVDVAAGALMTTDLENTRGASKYADFQGDKSKAFWHLDLELAQAADALHAGLTSKQPQFVTFADPKSGQPIFVGHDLRIRLPVVWNGPDTFALAATFLDRAPDKYPKVAEPVGHADGPARFKVLAGAVEQVGPTTFRVQLAAGRPLQASILAYHPGDSRFRFAEQAARIKLPDRLTQGKSQSISFLPVDPVSLAGAPVTLRATSSAGLPVNFYVESGPAVMDGDVLKLKDIPKRARFPLRITVVAYQYGSAIEPFIQSADPVKQVVSAQP